MASTIPIRLRKKVQKVGKNTVISFSREDLENHRITLGNLYDLELVPVPHAKNLKGGV